MRATLLGVATLAVVVSGCAVRKPASTRVVLVLDGKRVDAEPVADQLGGAIGEQYTLVPDDDYRKAAKSLKAGRVSKRNVAKVAAKIDADAVIVGQLDKRSKKKFRLYLQLRDGKTGAFQKSWKIDLKVPELGDDQRSQIDAILARLETIERRAPAAGDKRKPEKEPPEVDMGKVDPEEEEFVMDVQTDEKGQVIDEEKPPGM